MKQLMMDGFLPQECKQHLFLMYQYCEEGSRSIHDYISDFLKLMERNKLRETDDQQVSRFMNKLKPLFQDRMGLQVVYTFEQAYNPSLKVE